MREGLLWYDDDAGRNLVEKVGRAARRYQQKFGTPPDACYVHPSALEDNASASDASASDGRMQEVSGVRVTSKASVLRHHFWLGQEEKQRAGA